MKWTNEQNRALKAVAAWLKNPGQPIFRLFGYAGTGKTSLAKHFAEGVEGLVLFVAFTGKAAHVLRRKGCPTATTLHSLIYHTRDQGRASLKALEAELVEVLIALRREATDDETAEVLQQRIDSTLAVKNLRMKIKAEKEVLDKPVFTLNLDSDARDAALIIVDEWSQINERMGEDLLSFGTKLLVLGDPGQLPPVFGAPYDDKDCVPDILLTDVRRQAKDNPIIYLATEARMERPLQLGSYGESQVIEKAQLNAGIARAADQILVGRNKSRTMYNARMRTLLGRTGPLPEVTDRLVCLRNNQERGLFNGAVWNVDEIGDVGDEHCFLTISPEDGGEQLEVDMHSNYFLGQGTV